MAVVPGGGGGHHPPADFPRVVRALAAVSRALAFVEGLGIAVTLAALIVLALWQSIARTLHMGILPSLPQAPQWTNGVLRHAVFIIGFLGAMFATYSARHLRVDALTRAAGVRARLALRVIATLAAIAVCAAVTGWGWRFREGVLDELGNEDQLFTAARGAVILIAGLCGMVLHFLAQLAIDVTYLKRGGAVPAWWIAEAAHGGAPEASAGAPAGPAEPSR